MKRSTKPSVLSAPEWRGAVKEGKTEALSRFATIQRDAGGTGAPPAVSFIASTNQPDRYGDTIDQTGWDTASFESNPVLLWAHSYDCPPVGKVGALEKGAADLKCKSIEFTPREVHAFGADVGEMVRAGFLNTVSVGFIPLQWEERREPETGVFLGYHFVKQELLEISVVPVPANPGALVQSRGFASVLRGWAEKQDESSVQAREWRKELETWLRAAEVQVEQEQTSKDDSGFVELVELMRSLLESSRATNAHLAELRTMWAGGLVAKSVRVPQDATSQALAGALGVLFPPR
jgi:HK97 family phage prohead protease